MPPLLRPLVPADVPALAALAAARGGPPDEVRWRVLLACGGGVGALAPDGDLAGAVVRVDHGPALATGVLVVRPGAAEAARALLLRAVDRGRAPLAVMASTEAVPACVAVGFHPVDGVRRYARRGAAPAWPPPPGVALRPMSVADWPVVAKLDADAFGAPRRPVLERLFTVSERVVLSVRGGEVVGYGLAAAVAGGVRVGPIVAPDDETAAALAAFLAQGAAPRIIVDVPEERAGLRRWARASGFHGAGPAPILTPGGAPLPGARERLFALADPCLG